MAEARKGDSVNRWKSRFRVVAVAISSWGLRVIQVPSLIRRAAFRWFARDEAAMREQVDQLLDLQSDAEARNQAFQRQLLELIGGLARIDQVEAIEGRVRTLESNTAAFSQRIELVASAEQVTGVERRLGETDSNIAALSQGLALVATAEQVAGVENRLSESESSFATLSRRVDGIATEAQIRDLQERIGTLEEKTDSSQRQLATFATAEQTAQALTILKTLVTTLNGASPATTVQLQDVISRLEAIDNNQNYVIQEISKIGDDHEKIADLLMEILAGINEIKDESMRQRILSGVLQLLASLFGGLLVA